MPESDLPSTRRLRLRYPATCVVCKIHLSPKTEAIWDGEAKTATCLGCSGDSDVAREAAGVAGGSALAKAQELGSGRVAEARDRWGDHAAVVAARMAEGDPSIGSWVKGGAGESRLAAWIEREVGDAAIALHDRVIPGLRGTNIDHLFVAETGVWIVDTKAYKGKIEHRDVGPLWRIDPRLFVGGRDRTKLIDGLARQLTAVRAALEPDPAYEQIPIHPTLCFVESEWGLLQRPFTIRGVIVLYPGALRSRLKKGGLLSREAMERIGNRLALSLPASVEPSAKRRSGRS